MEFNLNIYQKVFKYIITIFESFIGFFVITYRYFINHNNDLNFNPDNNVTLVITSCNRFENLKKTLDSFKFYNTYNFKCIIHIEDGQCIKSINLVKLYFPDIELISIMNTTNIGQLNSIDKAYSFINTEFLFHLEEDWTFLKYGFVEYSLDLLKKNNNIIYVSLRSFDDQNNHSLKNFNNNYYYLKPFWKLVWIGFGFNPSLRRVYDYRTISKFGGINKRETGIGLFFYIIRKKLVIVSKTHIFVKHNGWDVSTINKYKKA